MYLFIEKELKGGTSFISKGQSDSDKEKKYIIYLDGNNLYGQAMSQYLLYYGFTWSNKKEINKFCLNFIQENSSISYILEFDLEYPDELHKMHNDYPLAPEKLEISQNMFSKYCINIADEYGIKTGGVNKLLPNLNGKNRYVLHYRNLKLYLSLGMKLTKVHRILKFKQSGWLKK